MFIVAAFYRFTRFGDPASIKAPLARIACQHGVKGTILIASEGINGTIAGTRDGVDRVLAHIRGLPGCADIDWKESRSHDLPFGRLKVRLKREIVTIGRPGIDPALSRGTYVAPTDWNALIDAPDVVVIDTRNDYEVAIGTFAGAEDPGTSSFGDFPAWWAANRGRLTGRRIAMFCTGGIRCEKATALVRESGHDAVFHLKGGILRYLEEIPAEESRWQGECFVFDRRVALGPGLSPGTHVLCHACRRPLSGADTRHPDYEEGVSCHRCTSEYTDADRTRFRERQRQVVRAAERGDDHLG